MKKGCLIFGVLAILCLIGAGYWISMTNKIVELDNDTKLKWGSVESAYQRRSELIPQLVAAVNKATNYEKETLTQVMEARAKATSVQIDPSNVTPEKLAEYQQAQAGVGSALGRLLVSVENYPDLKANQNILALQNQLEGTENRIKIERDNYNTSATIYNNYTQKFPGSIVAGIKGLKEKVLFKSDPGAEKAPDVDKLLNGGDKK